jgi:hypothetical protein
VVSLLDLEEPSREIGWTDSKFEELCFHRLPNDDEQQGPAVPTPVALLDPNLASLFFAADLLTASKPASSENSCRLFDLRKVDTIKTKRLQLIDSSDEDGFDYIHLPK